MSHVFIRTVGEDGSHNVASFLDVTIEYDVDMDIVGWGSCGVRPRRDTTYTITGTEGYTLTTGATAEEALANALIHQAQLGREAERQRDEARAELEDLRSRLRGLVDPPEDTDETDHYWE